MLQILGSIGLFLPHNFSNLLWSTFSPPCQAILLSLNHSVHLHPPSSEYFKRVKWKIKQKTAGIAQQKAHCQSALFTEGKAPLFYLLTCQFIYLFVWLNLLWVEGKGSRDHGREELSLRMSDHMMQSACVRTLREYFLFFLNSFVVICC